MTKLKIISWMLVLLLIIAIFLFSAQPRQKSNELSKAAAKIVVKVLEMTFPEKDFNINRVNHLLRKTTHFLIYFILGVLITNGLKVMELQGGKRIIYALVLCIVLAILDETHQFFVPGRGAQVRDVFIDSVGAAFGILSYQVLKGNYSTY